MKHLLINGCSHSAGSEIEGSGIGEGDYNRANCFGAQLARKLGVDYTNLALPGGSNDYILRSTMMWILDNPTLAKDTLFLIHWTGAARSEIFFEGTADEVYWNWIPDVSDKKVGHIHADHFARTFPKNIHTNLQILSKHMFLNETQWDVNKYLNIINLQTILESLDIRYIFKNSFENCNPSDRYMFYKDKINLKNFKGIFDKNESFFENCLAQGFSVEGQQYWHHRLEAHSYWADKLFKENFS